MSHSANQRERPCTIYIQQDEQNTSTSQEIQKTLETSKSIDDKIAAIKSLVINLIHDDSFPPMMMTIINFVLPVQNESHNLKKVLLYYWEVLNTYFTKTVYINNFPIDSRETRLRWPTQERNPPGL